MPTYKDLEEMVDRYLETEALYAKMTMATTGRPSGPGAAAVDCPGRWAVIKGEEGRHTRNRLFWYQDWLIFLKSLGVYDGPTELTYHGVPDGVR